jgi:hypothetical protein
MTDWIRVTASLRIERPADEVREQYRDIDHHIRNNVHPSIRYQWEPAEPGQRKIRTTFRILGVPQYDVSLLEDAEDGSFVIRYLEGSNAGMVLAHKFVPLAPNATDVQLVADAPATLGRKLLGPLFVVGARQVMKKALAEDKRDLEKGRFVPGRAAGNVERALEPVRAVANRHPQTKRAVLDAVCLVAVADGSVEASEREALERLVKLVGAEAEMPWVQQRLGELEKVALSDEIAREAERVGQKLQACSAAVEGLTAAAVIGLVSQGMTLGELELLRHMGAAAGILDESISAMVESADQALDRVE